MIKTHILILVVFGLSSHVFSQTSNEKYKHRLAPSIGISRQSETFVDVNLNLYSIDTSQTKLLAINGFRIGFESNLRQDNFVCGPKLGYEYAGTTILRLSAVNYFDKKNVDFRLLPEIGFSLCGTISILYGYNIPLTEYNSPSVGYHKFSVSILLDPMYWKMLGML